MRVAKGRVIQEAVMRMAKVSDAEGLLLQPHKRDRSVYIIRRQEEYEVFEAGFVRQNFTVEPGKLKKLLKTICKREFPRSNMVWVTPLAVAEASRIIKSWDKGDLLG